MNAFLKRLQRSRGFTLAEITIAVLVLSTASIVMIGLQSGSVDTSFRDERRQKALLAARAVFAALEILEDQPKDIDIEDSLINIIKKQAPLSELQDWDKLSGLEPFQAHYVIQNAPLPLKAIPPDELKRATLRVFWSNSPLDSIELYYFIPKKD